MPTWRPIISLLVIVLSACDPAPTAGPPPIILISLDTLRADHLGVYGDTRGLTPNLDRLAEESVVFLQAHSQATQTAPSHASLFTSRYPSEITGNNHQPMLGPEHPTLAQVLSAYGYQTAAFTAGGDLSLARKLNAGFEVWKSAADFASLWHTGPMALDWLDHADQDRPYLLFIHGYDTHSRYLKPTPFGYAFADAQAQGPGATAVRSATERIIDGRLHHDFGGLLRAYQEMLRPRDPAVRAEFGEILLDRAEAEPLTDADLEHVRGVYAGAVAWADTMVGRLLAGLERRGALDEAMVVVVSDHGEQLGEHGLFGHCCGVDDEETHVVMMIRPPGGGVARTVTEPVELVDVLPTLAEVVGATPPAGARGRSLVPALRGEPLAESRFSFTASSDMVRLVSVRSAAGRLSYAGLYAGSPYLPGLIATAALPGPGFTASPGLDVPAQLTLRDTLVSWVRSLAPPPGGTAEPLPPELVRSLRERGYWDASP